MSISTVAYEWPLRLATSSTPSTATGPACGSGSARASRIKVNRETTVPSAAASWEPARSASASATFSSRSRSPAVRRWYQLASPGTCSANVATGHAGLPQRNRRTSSTTCTGRPPQARSARRRRYRSCTRAEISPQPRQDSAAVRVLAAIRTPDTRSRGASQLDQAAPVSGEVAPAASG
jgi:hypothetical protein